MDTDNKADKLARWFSDEYEFYSCYSCHKGYLVKLKNKRLFFIDGKVYCKKCLLEWSKKVNGSVPIVSFH